MNRSARFFLLAALLCLLGATCVCAELPKGSIAVLTKGPSAQHSASVASIISSELIAKGHQVVDPKRLDAIRRNKAAALALEGNVDAIIKLSQQYGFSTMITAQLQAGKPVLNEFQLYTGTSSLAVMTTTSGGQVIYADTVMGKQVGYTPDEAAQKSIEAAARLAVARMLQ